MRQINQLKRDGDYRLWSAQFEASLTTLGMEAWLTEQPNPELPAEVTADSKARSNMLLAVADRGLARIIHRAATTMEAWELIRDEFEAEQELRRPLLMSQLNEVRQGSSETYGRYAERVLEILEKLEDAGFDGANQLAANAIVRGLKEGPEKGTLVLTLTQHIEAGFHRVVRELKSATRLLESTHDQRPSKNAEGRAMKADSQEKKKFSGKCFNCGKQGHMARDCRAPKKVEKPAAAMMATAEAAAMAASTPTGADDDDVLLDSGTSHHIFHKMGVIRNSRPSNTKRVVLGGGESHDVLCEGEVRLDGGPQGPIELRSVLCVPSMNVNLLSVNLATEAGHECHQRAGECSIIDPNGYMILKGYKRNRLYHLDCKAIDAHEIAPAAEAHAVLSEDMLHRRLGHPGRDAMQKTAAAAGLEVHADAHDPACGVCMRAKQSREPFRRSESQAEEVLELLHTDVMGPFQVPSWGGAVYAVTLMDDRSRMAEASCILRKSDVFQWIRDTILLWERQTGKKVKAVRSDNGTEFKGRLQEFFRDQGIIHQTSADYTPEQNGRAERLNRTLIEKVRAMLEEFKLSPKFWAAALETACYIRNCIPSKGTTESPHALFYGKAPDVHRLRVFGCLAYVHVPAAKRKKLDARAEAGFLAGYERNSKAYRVYVWRGGRFECVKSRNVRFDERYTCWMGQGLRVSDEELEFLSDGITQADPEGQAAGASNEPGDESDPYADMPSLEAASEYGDFELPEDEDLGTAAGDEGDDSEGADDSDEADDPGEADDSSDGGAAAVGPPEEAAQEAAQAHRYPQRARGPPDVYRPHAYNYAAAADGLTDEPRTTREALARADAQLWRESMDSEWASIQKRGVLEPMKEVPRGKKTLPMKAVYKIKRDATGAVEKYKTRLVVLGCMQKKGMDFEEVFAPTAQQATLRVMLAHAAEHDLDLHQFDVATAYLYGELAEQDEVYVRLPEEFGGGVFRLRKALYGLKQAARAWHAKLLEQLLQMGFTASEADPCMFYRGHGEERVYILIYVDDGIIIGNRQMVQAALAAIAGAFQIKDVGEPTYFLGLQLQRDREAGKIWLGQPKYARDMLERFGMSACRPVTSPMELNLHLSRSETPAGDEIPYAELVGSLLYLTTNTRPDLAFSVGVLSRFVSNPSAVHWRAAKRVLRYLAGTLDRGVVYQRGGPGVEAYTDADYAGETDTRKSTSGTVVLMCGGAVVWRSKLQTVVAASTCEAEYIAAAAAAKELLWVRKLLGEMAGQVQRIRLYGDNQSSLVLMKQHTPGASGRTKHIDVAYNFVRHRVMQGDIEPVFVGTEEMKADILTKALSGPKHEGGAVAMGLQNVLRE